MQGTTSITADTPIDIAAMDADMANDFAQEAEKFRRAIVWHLEKSFNRLHPEASVTAKDIFQDAVLNVLRYKAYWTTHLNMYEYLKVIATRLAIRHGQKEENRQRLLEAHRERLLAETAWGQAENEEGAYVTEPAVPDFTEELILKDGEKKLLAELGKHFNPRDVEMLDWYAEGYTQEEVAAAFEMKKSTLQYRLAKLRRVADLWLTKEGFTEDRFNRYRLATKISGVGVEINTVKVRGKVHGVGRQTVSTGATASTQAGQ